MSSPIGRIRDGPHGWITRRYVFWLCENRARGSESISRPIQIRRSSRRGSLRMRLTLRCSISTRLWKSSRRSAQFCLTRLWVVRGNGGKPRHHFDGIWQGLVAALLIWFSPDILLSAHAWITWDSWVVPWYLCVALLASLDWWFAAGLIMAVGAMFKAQELMVAPIFIIWPLMQWRFGAVLRWLTGLTFGIAVIASGWMLTYLPAGALAAARHVQEYTDVASYPRDLFAISRVFDIPAAIWIGEIILVAAAAPWILRNLLPIEPPPQPSRLQTILHSRWTWAAAAVILITCSIYWPFLLKDNRPYWYIGILGGAALAAASIALPPKNQPFVLAGAAGTGLLLCMLLFHGGTGWARCTFEYGTVHWPYMVMGLTDNIPGIFEARFGWPHMADDTAFTLPAIASHWPAFIARRAGWPAADVDVSAKTLFDSIYFSSCCSAELPSDSRPGARIDGYSSPS